MTEDYADVEPRSGRERQRRYRARLRAQGLRPVELWLPDTRQPAFIEACRRQSRLISDTERRQRDENFWEAAADLDDWTA